MNPLRGLVRRLKRRVHTHEFWELHAQVQNLSRRMDRVQEALGRIEARQLQAQGDAGLNENEFRVFSQWGEDGIIQYLIRHVPIERRAFVEIGVEGYTEANTRYLLVNDNWSGLIVEGDSEQIERIRRRELRWLYDLAVEPTFVTRDNINGILRRHGMTGSIGLLSIDIDGVDYWIWDAIDTISPAIVVMEYNYRFGPEAAVTVPYDPQFDRRAAHHSLLYYGASLRALTLLADRKGYALVGTGAAGLNAFFVHRDLLSPPLREVDVTDAFRIGQFCEAHDEHGRRVRTSYEQEHELVMSLPLVRVDER